MSVLPVLVLLVVAVWGLLVLAGLIALVVWLARRKQVGRPGEAIETSVLPQ